MLYETRKHENGKLLYTVEENVFPYHIKVWDFLYEVIVLLN